MESLQKIRSLSPSIIYPGHGPVLKDPMSIIDGYIEHRMQRENQVLMSVSVRVILRPSSHY